MYHGLVDGNARCSYLGFIVTNECSNCMRNENINLTIGIGDDDGVDLNNNFVHTDDANKSLYVQKYFFIGWHSFAKHKCNSK